MKTRNSQSVRVPGFFKKIELLAILRSMAYASTLGNQNFGLSSPVCDFIANAPVQLLAL